MIDVLIKHYSITYFEIDQEMDAIEFAESSLFTEFAESSLNQYNNALISYFL